MTGPSTGYEDSAPFLARVALYAHVEDPVDMPGAALAALTDVTGVVVDVGCGPGIYVRRFAEARPDLRVAATDLSPGMRPMVVGDAVRLPYADGAADAALAMHMLYHASDIPAAIAELRRVVRPGGVVVASTNARGDKSELADLWDAVLDELAPGRRRPFVVPTAVFDAHLAEELLAAVFDDVAVQRFERPVVVRDLPTVMAALDSYRAFHEAALPRGVTWEAYLAATRRHVEATMARDGAFTVSTRFAIFTCR